MWFHFDLEFGHMAVVGEVWSSHGSSRLMCERGILLKIKKDDELVVF